MTHARDPYRCFLHPASADARMFWAVTLCAGLAVGCGGCASPLVDRSDRDLRRSVREAVEREMVESQSRPEPLRLTRRSQLESLGIAPETLKLLEAKAGPASYPPGPPPLGASLYGDVQSVSSVTLERAVTATVKNNLNVEFARLAVAISQNQLNAADAAFDATLFGSSQFNHTDAPRTSSSVGGFVSGVSVDNREVGDTTVGLRKPLISGGQVSIQTQYTYTDNTTPGLTVSPNPAYESNLVIQLDQPLARGFGSDVAESNIRLARNTELDQIQQLKGALLQNVTDVETAYWNLVRAQADLRIIHRLVERGEETFKILESRKGFDAKPANISNVRSAVQSRRSDFIRAQNAVRDASDRLKELMNDPEYKIGDETLLLPVDGAVDQAVEFSVYDAFQSAIANRPEVQRAILSIDNTSIRLLVADNARLPRLDLRAQIRLNGLDGSPGSSYSNLSELDFIDYQIGLQFEQPIGNRAAESTYRFRGLERSQAAISYRNTIRGILQEIKTTLRQVQTNYELIEQTRTARVAATEDLRTLEVEEDTIQSLSPEFLNLKLQRQQSLAAAEQQEIQALTDYNASLARYYSASGTALARNKIQFDVPSLVPELRVREIFPDWPTERQRERARAKK